MLRRLVIALTWALALMFRHRSVIALAGALALAFSSGAVWAAVTSAAQSLSAESGSPINDQGSSYHYRTYITSITPRTPGLSVEVLEFADRLLLRNQTGKTVMIYGYSGEPYARVQPDGTTEQNVRSPAVYLNTSFYANVTVPPSASASATPRWTVLDRTGELEWHDHRIHWMSPVKPPQVTDEGRRTKIFDWSVPIKVGTRPGVIRGELFWVPQSSKTPTAAIVALVALVLLSVGLVVVVRRRRARSGPPGASPEQPGGPARAGDPGPQVDETAGSKEAW